MTRKIKVYELDSCKTLPYFLSHIQCGKSLSIQICEMIDFNKGRFFTILPETINLDRLFNFDTGIIPSVPNSVNSAYIVTMDQECTAWIARFLEQRNDFCAVVENYMLEPDSPFVGIKNVQMAPLDSEVYYILNHQNSPEEIYTTIRKSSLVWHSLIVLTQIQKTIPNKLTTSIINEICKYTKIVIAGAYDGEGYIFWERS